MSEQRRFSRGGDNTVKRDFSSTQPRSSTQPHPAQLFEAPSSIQRGVPLRELFDGKLIRLIGASLKPVVPSFDEGSFTQDAGEGLEELEFKERAAHIASAMARQLPADFAEAAPLLINSFGPSLTGTAGNGLAVFFYMPHSAYVAEYGTGCFEDGMRVNFELTKRFTAEFSLRPFLVRYRSQCLRTLRIWATNPDPHVRRLVSEATRPRLPWAMRLAEFQANPQLSLPLLELLKDDPELYVRRSVANHLGDLVKDHPDVIFDVCDRWLRQVQNAAPQRAGNRRWVIRHALRHPARLKVRRALQIREQAR